jgi:hypothetical protein
MSPDAAGRCEVVKTGEVPHSRKNERANAFRQRDGRPQAIDDNRGPGEKRAPERCGRPGHRRHRKAHVQSRKPPRIPSLSRSAHATAQMEVSR